MFAVIMNGDTPFGIVRLEQQWTIHAGPGAPLICHGCIAHKSDRLPRSVKPSLYIVAIGKVKFASSARLRTAARGLCLEKHAQHRGPPSLEVDFPLQSALQQSLDPPLRFKPRQRGLKGGQNVEDPVGGWQRNLVNEILRRGDGTPIEGGDPARERVDEAVQFRLGKCPVDISVSFRSVAVEVVRAENDFERAATADQMWEAFRTAAARMQSHPDFGLAQSRVLARREAHVAGEDELAAHAPDTASDLRDADHWGLGETHERIHQDREDRSSGSSHDVPYLAGQIKVGKVKLGVRAFEYDDPQARAGVHSREQIL